MQWPFILSRFLYLESNEYGIIYENIMESWCRCFVLISLPWSSLYHCSSKVLVFLVLACVAHNAGQRRTGELILLTSLQPRPPIPTLPLKVSSTGPSPAVEMCNMSLTSTLLGVGESGDNFCKTVIKRNQQMKVNILIWSTGRQKTFPHTVLARISILSNKNMNDLVRIMQV